MQEFYICNNCGFVANYLFDLSLDPLNNQYFCPNCKSYDVEEVDEKTYNEKVGIKNE